MSELVTLNLPDQVVRVAATIANRKRQALEEVLVEMLTTTAAETPIESLPDDEVLALSEMMMPKEQSDRLSELLAQQRENQLDGEDRKQLSQLMWFYEKGLLRKSQALREAVERGLREPLAF
ncbi:MAG: hypothetical protein JST84_07355 [Acidobacteria bacterium]|nr:hypothetical protein [Acidobacteriota bacterium]